MNRFMKEEPYLYSVLSAGALTNEGGDENVYSWQPKQTEGLEFLIDSLKKDERRQKILKGLKDITGAECHFEIVQSGHVRKEDVSEKAYINQLYETFGKEPVVIQE